MLGYAGEPLTEKLENQVGDLAGFSPSPEKLGDWVMFNNETLVEFLDGKKEMEYMQYNAMPDTLREFGKEAAWRLTRMVWEES